MQICTTPQIDNHTNIPSLSFYRLDALPATQPTASKHYNLCNVKTSVNQLIMSKNPGQK